MYDTYIQSVWYVFKVYDNVLYVSVKVYEYVFKVYDMYYSEGECISI